MVKSNTKLKIAFIINNSTIPLWYWETIRSILDNNCYEVLLIESQFIKAEHQKTFLYKLFQKFENWWFRPKHEALAMVDMKSIDDSFQIIKLGISDFQLSQEQLDLLLPLKLDVIYTIDFEHAAKENISAVARYGLWYIKFGYGKFDHPYAFWEVMSNSEVTGSYLLSRINGEDKILYEGTTPTVPYSVKNNLNSIAWKSSSYLKYRLLELTCSQDEIFRSKSNYFPSTRKPLPGHIKLLWLIISNFTRYIKYKLNRSTGKFQLLYSCENIDLNAFTGFNFKSIPPSPGTFWADPFVIGDNGKCFIFFEEYVYSKDKAHISLMAMDENENFTQPEVVLEMPYHLSYPFVFKHENEYFMLPETSSKGTVELYKAIEFPYKWKHIMNLIENRPLIDCTLLHYNGLWWLFCSSTDHPATSANDQLHLYYTNNLFSKDWKLHPQSPIATHAGNCRPAGRIFESNGKLYRPAQNNASKQYGYGLKINEIIVINEREYFEKEVYSINPESLGLKAVHQIDFIQNLVFIDGIVP